MTSPVLIPAIVTVGALACGHHGRPDSGPAPPVAGSWSDSVAARSFLIPGTVQANWNRVNRALTDSSYRYEDGDFGRGIMNHRSLLAGRLIRAEMTAAGRDSVRVRLTGRRYVGAVDRPGVILASDSAWPLIRSSDTVSTILDLVAARIRATFAHSPEPPRPAATAQGRAVPLLHASPDSTLRDLPGGSKGFCKANTVLRGSFLTVDNVNLNDWCAESPYEVMVYNTYVLEPSDSVRVGDTVDVCTFSSVPRGFEIIEWFPDPARCPFDPNWLWKDEPNMMRLRRWR